MADDLIVKVKKYIKEAVIDRWSDTKIKEKDDSLIYDIQHKHKKVSYSTKLEYKDDVLNIAFRSKPYEKYLYRVDSFYGEELRCSFFQTARKGITNVSMELEEIKNTDGVIPVICFDYWICKDIKDDALKEIIKLLMQMIVPNDCIQLMNFLESNPTYLYFM